MGRGWKHLRTNWMYWRFRYVTRNRLRLRNWWSHHRLGRPGARSVPYSGVRGRGTASVLRYTDSSSRRSWLIFLVMTAMLTAVHMAVAKGVLAGSIGGVVDTVIVVGALYIALRAL